MPKFNVIAEFSYLAELEVEACNEAEAWAIAKTQAGEFEELPNSGECSLERVDELVSEVVVEFKGRSRDREQTRTRSQE